MADQKAIITQAARKYGIDPKVLYGLWGTETGYSTKGSTSSAGAVGPFQFLPSTAKGMGVNPYNFKSAAYGAAKYLSQYKARGVAGMLSAYNAGPAGGLQQGYVDTTLKNAQSYGSAPSLPLAAPRGAQAASIPGASEGGGLDQAAFQKAKNAAILGKLLSSGGGASDNPLFKSGLVTTKAPDPAEYQLPSRPAKVGVEGATPIEPSTGVHLGKAMSKGIVDFEGKKVAGWIAPILTYARKHGWTGHVESGFRSRSEQEQIYNSGVRPAAKPGTSNHEGDEFPRGAVDVSRDSAAQLAQFLKRSPYAGTLEWAGSADPVHFSKHRNGSY